MLKSFRRRLLQRLQLEESWVIFFIMGIIMMNFPFILIFNKADTIFGFPLMFLYLYFGWAVSIFVIYIFALAVRHGDDKKLESKEQ